MIEILLDSFRKMLFSNQVGGISRGLDSSTPVSPLRNYLPFPNKVHSWRPILSHFYPWYFQWPFSSLATFPLPIFVSELVCWLEFLRASITCTVWIHFSMVRDFKNLHSWVISITRLVSHEYERCGWQTSHRFERLRKKGNMLLVYLWENRRRADHLLKRKQSIGTYQIFCDVIIVQLYGVKKCPRLGIVKTEI